MGGRWSRLYDEIRTVKGTVYNLLQNCIGPVEMTMLKDEVIRTRIEA